MNWIPFFRIIMIIQICVALVKWHFDEYGFMFFSSVVALAAWGWWRHHAEQKT